MGGIQPLWRDAVFCHEQKPLHVMVGGGDQLCCDEVWNLPSLVQVGCMDMLAESRIMR